MMQAGRELTRRRFLEVATALAALGGLVRSPSAGEERASRSRLARRSTGAKTKGMRVDEVTCSFQDYRYRTPYKFGGHEVDRVTLLNVECAVHLEKGGVARGFGSMTMGNVWSFPSETLSYEATLGAMKALAARIREIIAGCDESGHPIELTTALEPEYLKAAAQVSRELRLAEPVPKLCALVTASPFDAALHDAFGKAHGLNCYRTYGAEFLSHDLSRYLGPEFAGEYLDRYILKQPRPRLDVYHSVGASDPIVSSDVVKRLNDGLPESLPDWIRYNGLAHFKIKLNGNDLKWDIERVLHIDRAVSETETERGVSHWTYSLDFNEKCPNVAYLLEFLGRIKEKTPAGNQRIQYVEQPTARDLAAHRENVMQEAARLRPVVIDESLTGLDMLMLARQMGYTGVALKACKGQSQSLLMAAAAQKYGMFRCAQDLTCPGASLVHSAGLASHVPGVSSIEANAREYVPAANQPWEGRFPGIFVIRDGTMDTSGLTRPGLSVV
jgi:L-alanine-DL-glutamate epimerase-like enolase superfamily enzyme